MAPAFNPGIDYESLIYQNCRVFLGSDVDLKVVTQYDSSKRWHAHVLKTTHGKRTVTLSESSKSAAQALELLHEKSAIAVDHYVSTNGFALPPRFSTRSSHSSGEDNSRSANEKDALKSLEHSEVIALCGSSSSEASDSEDSEDELKNSLATRRRKSRPTSQAMSPGRSRPEIVEPPRPRNQISFVDPRGRTAVYPSSSVPISAPIPTLMGPQVTRTVPPFQPGRIPPQGWKPSAHIPYPPPPMHPVQRMPISNFPPPPLPRVTPSQVPIKLNIQWPGHGNKKFLVRAMPTKQDISRVALREVQQRAAEFPLPWGAPLMVLNAWKATIRTVSVGDEESYDVKTFGSDFSSLCGDGKPILGVDIDIKEAGPSQIGDFGSDNDIADY